MDGQGMDQENFEGCTPLGCALAYGHVEVAAFLVKVSLTCACDL